MPKRRVINDDETEEDESFCADDDEFEEERDRTQSAKSKLKRSIEDDEDDDEAEEESVKIKAPKKARQDIVDPLFEEDSESDDSEDEGDRAEARIHSRLDGTKNTSSSGLGIIDEISMEHFMCHKRLTVKLCKRINFISGANGSGKSAILAALQICLGASAKSTHRGSKMGDLVREGHQGQAVVRVSLVNEGQDAIQPDVYGNRITIERKFARDGKKTELRLLSTTQTVVSRDRKALRDILDAFKICVENPVCVLDQENSKHFIRGKAKEKYDFFLKATEIQQVLTKIRIVSDAADQCAADAERQRGRLEGYANAYNQAKAEYDELERMHKLDEHIIDLKAASGWVHVASAEKSRDRAQSALEEAQETARAAQTQYEKAQGDFDAKYKAATTTKGTGQHAAAVVLQNRQVLADATNQASGQDNIHNDDNDAPMSRIAQIEEKITRLKDELEACRDSTKKTNQDISAARSQHNKLKRALDTADREARSSKKEVAAATQHLRDCKEKNATRQKTQSQACATATLLQDKVQVLEAESIHLRNAADSAEQAVKEASLKKENVMNTTKALQQALHRLEGQLRADQARLNQLEAQTQSPLAAFGREQPRIHAAVQRHLSEFDIPPVGPIGACLKLANPQDKKWIGALSASISGLGRWIVSSPKDRALLTSIARQAGHEITIIVQKQRPRYRIRDLVAMHHGRIEATVASVLRIDNDIVFNALVDNYSIDTVALYSSKDDAENRGMNCHGDRFDFLQGVSRIFLANADETGTRKGSLFYKRSNLNPQHTPLASTLGDTNNTVELLDETKNSIRALQDEVNQARSELEASNRESQIIKSAEATAKRTSKQRTEAYDTLESQLNTMRADLQRALAESQAESADLVLEDVGGAETDLRQCQEALRTADISVGEARAALEKHAEEIMAPLTAVKAQHDARNRELLQEDEYVGRELADLLALQEDDKQRVAKEKKKADKARARIADFETALEEEDKRVQAYINKAKDLTRSLLGADYNTFPHPEAKKYKNGDVIQAKVDALSKQKAKALNAKDIKERDPQVAKEKMLRARAAYLEKEQGCRQIEIDGIDLKADAVDRWDRLRSIRRHICRQSDTSFDEILQKKGSSGMLKFDHSERTLGLVFQKDNSDASTQLDNITSLSGGERSFTTLAMLISIGSTIDCPFRVMDEFDVFMDQVARKVAMKELVEVAQTYENRQFIFITPQDLSSLPQSEILKVFKLHPPIRGQQTINFAPRQSQSAPSQVF